MCSLKNKTNKNYQQTVSFERNVPSDDCFVLELWQELTHALYPFLTAKRVLLTNEMYLSVISYKG